MMLIEETTVPDENLPVDIFKAHLRLGTGFADDAVQDAVLMSFLRAAMAAVEARTGKALIQRAFAWSLTGWRAQSEQVLPIAPVQTLTEVALIDDQGIETPIAANLYRLEKDPHRPRIKALGAAFPMVPERGSVVIRFEAGFGIRWELLPADLAQAVLLLAAHYYEFRHETSLSDGCMPFGVTSLIERYKVMRLYSGSAK